MVVQADADGAPFEIIFLDWQIGGSDGLDLARQIRQLSHIPAPNIVLMSEYGAEAACKEAVSVGIEDVLIKPICASALFDTVVRVLGDTTDAGGLAHVNAGQHFGKLAAIAGSRILVVEDNELNQEVATELLLSAGFVVELAENGQVALEMVQRRPYDIVLMDVQMPVMDGLAASRAIRVDARYADLPIVAMTASAMQGDRERCLAAGMNDHVAKPIEPDELWKALLKWIKPRANIDDDARQFPQFVAAQAAPVIAAPPLTAKPHQSLSIDGLNLEDALRRLLGNKALLLSILRQFHGAQKDLVTQIGAALDMDDWNSAERMAHTLRGSAGNIGATEVQQRAEVIETALRLRQPRSAVDQRLAELRGPLAQLCEQLQQKLPSAGKKSTPKAQRLLPVDAAQLKIVCDSLEKLLQDDDAAASDLLHDNQDLLSAAFPKRYAALAADIQSFDYDLALVVLRLARSAQPELVQP
jgi:two-component system sensor histidine kinase/response regulator